LERLYLDNNLLRSMKVNSRKGAKEMSWEKVAGEYYQLYLNTLI